MSAGTFKYNLRFPGQIYDLHAGLHQNYFRDYDSAVGRYTESDVLGIADGPNTYLYAKAAPSTLTDMFGLTSDDQCCNRSQQLGQHENPNSVGWVICCEGRKVPCAYKPRQPRQGWNLLQTCILKHEGTHLSEIQCSSCTRDPVRPDPGGPGYLGYAKSECRAGTVEMTCLRNSLSQCGNNDACRNEVMRFTASRERFYRGCGGGL